MSEREEEFRAVVRSLISRGRYPDVVAIRQAMGGKSYSRSGLSADQTAWRTSELENAGYDWELTKKSRKLTKRSR